MTILEVEAFLNIVKSGSLTASADSLFISQPALSRRMAALEKELGYTLILRKKGQRRIELTAKGRAFIPLAEQWLKLWGEVRDLAESDTPTTFRVASVGSVSTYILPGVFRSFMQAYPDCPLVFNHYHSQEAYAFVSSGETDLALVSDQQYAKDVKTALIFEEPMVLVSNGLPNLGEQVHPTELKSSHEIKLPWNPETDQWNDYWFGRSAKFKVTLNQMSLLEDFMADPQSWAVVPKSVSKHLLGTAPLRLHQILDGPQSRKIYALSPMEGSHDLVPMFMQHLRTVLSQDDDFQIHFESWP